MPLGSYKADEITQHVVWKRERRTWFGGTIERLGRQYLCSWFQSTGADHDIGRAGVTDNLGALKDANEWLRENVTRGEEDFSLVEFALASDASETEDDEDDDDDDDDTSAADLETFWKLKRKLFPKGKKGAPAAKKKKSNAVVTFRASGSAYDENSDSDSEVEAESEKPASSSKKPASESTTPSHKAADKLGITADLQLVHALLGGAQSGEVSQVMEQVRELCVQSAAKPAVFEKLVLDVKAKHQWAMLNTALRLIQTEHRVPFKAFQASKFSDALEKLSQLAATVAMGVSHVSTTTLGDSTTAMGTAANPLSPYAQGIYVSTDAEATASANSLHTLPRSEILRYAEDSSVKNTLQRLQQVGNSTSDLIRMLGADDLPDAIQRGMTAAFSANDARALPMVESLVEVRRLLVNGAARALLTLDPDIDYEQARKHIDYMALGQFSKVSLGAFLASKKTSGALLSATTDKDAASAKLATISTIYSFTLAWNRLSRVYQEVHVRDVSALGELASVSSDFSRLIDKGCSLDEISSFASRILTSLESAFQEFKQRRAPYPRIAVVIRADQSIKQRRDELNLKAAAKDILHEMGATKKEPKPKDPDLATARRETQQGLINPKTDRDDKSQSAKKKEKEKAKRDKKKNSKMLPVANAERGQREATAAECFKWSEDTVNNSEGLCGFEYYLGDCVSAKCKFNHKHK